MSDAEANAFMAALFVFFIVFIIISIILYIINSIFLSKIFKKAGVPGYIAWVPGWNNWKLFELGNQKGYISLLVFVSIILSNIGGVFNSTPAFDLVILLVNLAASLVCFVFFIKAMINVGKNLGKGTVFVILGVFLYTVWLGILAFDKSTWKGIASNQIQSNDGVISQNPQQSSQQPVYTSPNIPNQAPVQQNPNPNPNDQPPQPPAPIQ